MNSMPLWGEVIAAELERNREELAKQPRSLDDFYAYLPLHKYIFRPTREMWPSSSINSVLPIAADKETPAQWLDRNRAVDQMTWAPGEPELIEDRVMVNGGWNPKSGARCFNLYLPSSLVLGDATQARPWLELGKKIYPDDFSHIKNYFAFKVQNAGKKINHGLVMGGDPGVGKDSLIEPSTLR